MVAVKLPEVPVIVTGPEKYAALLLAVSVNTLLPLVWFVPHVAVTPLGNPDAAKERQLYIDVDLTRGPNYGNTLTWTAPLKPETDVQLVHAQMDLDLPKFSSMFVTLMKAPPPKK